MIRMCWTCEVNIAKNRLINKVLLNKPDKKRLLTSLARSIKWWLNIEVDGTVNIEYAEDIVIDGEYW